MLYLPTTPGSLGGDNINNLNEKEIQNYGNNFDDKNFWSKLISCATTLGKEGVYLFLLLYYALKSNIPASIKLIIIGAICWFLSPVDAVPDCIPVVGYADDLSALLFAKHKAEEYISADVTALAKNKLTEFEEVIR